jgi:hypothetical protein
MLAVRESLAAELHGVLSGTKLKVGREQLG